MNGYLAADPALVTAAAARLATHSAGVAGEERPLRVGVSWRSGNAGLGAHKSIPLAQWAPILRIPKVAFVSLQYGDTASERAAVETELGVPVWQDPDVDPLQDMDAAAAQLACLDLVVTVSNTAAHLAGALGVPTWLLLPAPGHGLLWYWMLDRTDSPFYPSLRCFRQRRPGDWSGVIGMVAEALIAKQRAAG